MAKPLTGGLSALVLGNMLHNENDAHLVKAVLTEVQQDVLEALHEGAVLHSLPDGIYAGLTYPRRSKHTGWSRMVRADDFKALLHAKCIAGEADDVTGWFQEYQLTSLGEEVLNVRTQSSDAACRR